MIYHLLVLVCDGCHGIKRQATLDLAPNGSLSPEIYAEQVEALLDAERFSTRRFQHHCEGCSKARLAAAEQKVQR